MGVNLSERSFLLSNAAEAAGVTVQVVRMWLKRKTIWFDESEMQTAPSNGLPHQITFTSVMRIAIMGKLLGLGISPSQAWAATMAFTDLGDGDTAIANEGEQLSVSRSLVRKPGELYSEGFTVLLAYADAVPGVVINITRDTPMQDVFFPKGLSESRKAAAAIVNINFVDLEVRKRLNVA